MHVCCREWHEERMKLLHCIHMQQMEMSQRSIAAHDRAVDIAKVSEIQILHTWISKGHDDTIMMSLGVCPGY